MSQEYDVHLFGAILFFILPLCTFTSINDVGLSDQSILIMKDDNIEVIIDVEGRNISETLGQEKALLIDPNEGVDIHL